MVGWPPEAFLSSRQNSGRPEQTPCTLAPLHCRASSHVVLDIIQLEFYFPDSAKLHHHPIPCPSSCVEVNTRICDKEVSRAVSTEVSTEVSRDVSAGKKQSPVDHLLPGASVSVAPGWHPVAHLSAGHVSS